MKLLKLILLSIALLLAVPKQTQAVLKPIQTENVQAELINSNEFNQSFIAKKNKIGAIGVLFAKDQKLKYPLELLFTISDENGQEIHQERRYITHINQYNYVWFGFPIQEDSQGKKFLINLKSDSEFALAQIESYTVFTDKNFASELKENWRQIIAKKWEVQKIFWILYSLLLIITTAICLRLLHIKRI